MSNYSVGELAKLSGVSVRTLHHYDSKGLLSPVHKDSTTKYRFYGKPELLRLQQILFYKKLGFSLDQIKKILNQDSFSLLSSLKTQRKMFLEKVEQSKKVVETIDLTIAHLKEKTKMEDKQFFQNVETLRAQTIEQLKKPLTQEGNEKLLQTLEMLKKRSPDELTETEKFMQAQGDPEIFNKTFEYLAKMSKEERTAMNLATAKVMENFNALCEVCKKGFAPDSLEAQELLDKNHLYSTSLNIPSGIRTEKNYYLGMAKLYTQNEQTRKMLENTDPRLPEFLSEAMIIWANKNFK